MTILSDLTSRKTNPSPPCLITSASTSRVAVREGDDAFLLVLKGPGSGPILDISWAKGSRQLVGDRYHVGENNNSVHLTLRGITREDEGEYTVTAKNIAGESRSAVYLRIKDGPFDDDEAPIFLRRLNDLAVKVGTRTRFLVEIRSSSDVQVTWHRNDIPIPEEDRFHFLHEGNFFCVDVAPVSVEDNGRWSCVAENSTSRSSCSCRLNVLIPKAYKAPEFLEQLRAVLTDQGTVSLECKVVGVPTPILRWYKDGKEIKPGDMFALTANPDDPTSLGIYTCEATNCMGKTYSSSRVHVSGRGSREGSLLPADHHFAVGPPPIFKRELRNERVKIGTGVTLSCQVSVPPWPKSINWYNKEGKIEPGEKYHIMEDGLGGYSIEIYPLEADDEGDWKCVATSDTGVMTISKCTVSMTYPKNYRKPKFLESLKAILTEEGLVSFECKVVGFPTPRLQWFKDGQELRPGDVYQLTGTNSLGSYSCIARNCMGEARSTAELTVEDIQSQLNEEERLHLFSKNQPPRFIRGLKSCEAKINEDFRFTVQVTLSPEANLTWYRDDEKIENDERYSVVKENVGVCHLHVKGLEVRDQAEWKCVASNDFGQSLTTGFLKLSIPKHYKKPKFLECLRAILSEEGAVNLECKVIGVPQPVLKWYKDGKELKPGDIHRITSGQDGKCCLGTYTCEARNCMGSVSSSASLLGFEDRKAIKEIPRYVPEPLYPLAKNTSLSTIHEERTSQLYDTPGTEHSVTVDERGDVSFSFDGKEVSISLYETPDLTEEEALKVVEMYAEELSEHISEQNVVELPPMRFTKESSKSGPLLMEAVVIDVSEDYFSTADDDLRTEADFEDVSMAEEGARNLPSPETENEAFFEKINSDFLERALASFSPGKRSSGDSKDKSDSFKSLSSPKKASRGQVTTPTQEIVEAENFGAIRGSREGSRERDSSLSSCGKTTDREKTKKKSRSRSSSTDSKIQSFEENVEEGVVTVTPKRGSLSRSSSGRSDGEPKAVRRSRADSASRESGDREPGKRRSSRSASGSLDETIVDGSKNRKASRSRSRSGDSEATETLVSLKRKKKTEKTASPQTKESLGKHDIVQQGSADEEAKISISRPGHPGTDEETAAKKPANKVESSGEGKPVKKKKARSRSGSADREKEGSERRGRKKQSGEEREEAEERKVSSSEASAAKCEEVITAAAEAKGLENSLKEIRKALAVIEGKIAQGRGGPPGELIRASLQDLQNGFQITEQQVKGQEITEHVLQVLVKPMQSFQVGTRLAAEQETSEEASEMLSLVTNQMRQQLKAAAAALSQVSAGALASVAATLVEPMENVAKLLSHTKAFHADEPMTSVELLQNLAQPVRELREAIEGAQEENASKSKVLSSLVEPMANLKLAITAVEERAQTELADGDSVPEKILKRVSRPVAEISRGLSAVEARMQMEDAEDLQQAEDNFEILRTLSRPIEELHRGLAEVVQEVLFCPADTRHVSVLAEIARSASDLLNSLEEPESEEPLSQEQKRVIFSPLKAPLASLRDSIAVIEATTSPENVGEVPPEVVKSNVMQVLKKPLDDLKLCIRAIEDDVNQMPPEVGVEVNKENMLQIVRDVDRGLQEVTEAEKPVTEAFESLAIPLQNLKACLSEKPKARHPPLSKSGSSLGKSLDLIRQGSEEEGAEAEEAKISLSVLRPLEKPLQDLEEGFGLLEQHILQKERIPAGEKPVIEGQLQALLEILSQSFEVFQEKWVTIEARKEDRASVEEANALLELVKELKNGTETIGTNLEELEAISPKTKILIKSSVYSNLKKLATSIGQVETLIVQESLQVIPEFKVLAANIAAVQESLIALEKQYPESRKMFRKVARPILEVQSNLERAEHEDKETTTKSALDEMVERTLQAFRDGLNEAEDAVVEGGTFRNPVFSPFEALKKEVEENVRENVTVDTLPSISKSLETFAKQVKVNAAKEVKGAHPYPLTRVITLIERIVAAIERSAARELESTAVLKQPLEKLRSNLEEMQASAGEVTDQASTVALEKLVGPLKKMENGFEDSMEAMDEWPPRKITSLADTIADVRKDVANVQREVALQRSECDAEAPPTRANVLSGLTEPLQELVKCLAKAEADVRHAVMVQGTVSLGEEVTRALKVSVRPQLVQALVSLQESIAGGQVVPAAVAKVVSEIENASPKEKKTLLKLRSQLESVEQDLSAADVESKLPKKKEERETVAACLESTVRKLREGLESGVETFVDERHNLAALAVPLYELGKALEKVSEGRDLIESAEVKKSLANLAIHLERVEKDLAKAEANDQLVSKLISEMKENVAAMEQLADAEGARRLDSLPNVVASLSREFHKLHEAVLVTEETPAGEVRSLKTDVSVVKNMAQPLHELQLKLAEIREHMKLESADNFESSVLQTLAEPVQKLQTAVAVFQQQAMETSGTTCDPAMENISEPVFELQKGLAQIEEQVILIGTSETGREMVKSVAKPIQELVKEIVTIHEQLIMEPETITASTKADLSVLQTLAKPAEELQKLVAVVQQCQLIEAETEPISSVRESAMAAPIENLRHGLEQLQNVILEATTVADCLPALAAVAQPIRELQHSFAVVLSHEYNRDETVVPRADVELVQKLATPVHDLASSLLIVQQQLMESGVSSFSQTPVELEPCSLVSTIIKPNELEKMIAVIEQCQMMEPEAVSLSSAQEPSLAVSLQSLRHGLTQLENVLLEGANPIECASAIEAVAVPVLELEKCIATMQTHGNFAEGNAKDTQIAVKLSAPVHELVSGLVVLQQQFIEAGVKSQPEVMKKSTANGDQIMSPHEKIVVRGENLAEEGATMSQVTNLEEATVHPDTLHEMVAAQTEVPREGERLVETPRNKSEFTENQQIEERRATPVEEKIFESFKKEESEEEGTERKAKPSEKSQGLDVESRCKPKHLEKEESAVVSSERRESITSEYTETLSEVESLSRYEDESLSGPEDASREKKVGISYIKDTNMIKTENEDENVFNSKGEMVRKIGAKKKKEDEIIIKDKSEDGKQKEEQELKKEAVIITEDGNKKHKDTDDSQKRQVEDNIKLKDVEHDEIDKSKAEIEAESKKKKEDEEKKKAEDERDAKKMREEEEKEKTEAEARKKEEEEVKKKAEAEAKAKKEKEEAEAKKKKEEEEARKKKEEEEAKKKKEEEEAKKKAEAEAKAKKEKEEAEAKKKKEEEEAKKKAEAEAEAKKKKEKEEAEAKKKKEEEEARKKKEEEEAKKKKEEEEAKKKAEAEAEAKKKKEKEEAEAKKKKEEEEARKKKEEEEAKKKAEAEAEEKAKKKKEEEEAKKKKEKEEAEAKKKKEEEEAKKKKEKEEAEAKKKAEAEAEAEAKKKKEEEEARKKKEEEEARKKKEEEEAKKKAEAEEKAKKKKEEEEAKKKKEKEEAEAKKKAEAEAEAKKKKEEEEAKAKKEKEEAKKKAEAKAKKEKEEEEAKKKAEAEAKAKKEKEEEEARKKKEEEEAKKKAEAEAKAKKEKEEEEARKKKEEEEAKKKKEKEEAVAKKKKEEEEAKKKAEAEAKAKKEKEEEEAKKKAEAEAKAKKEKEEEEARKKKEEEEARKKKEEEEAKKKAEAEAKAKEEKEEAEAKKKKEEEEAKKKAEAEAEEKAKKEKEEAEAKKKKEEEEAKKKKEKEEAVAKKKKEEEEARKKKEEEEAKKKKEKEEAVAKKKKEEEEVKKKAEAEEKAKKEKEEAEAKKKKEEEEARKKKEEEEDKKKKEKEEAEAKKKKEVAEAEAREKKDEGKGNKNVDGEAAAREQREEANTRVKEKEEGDTSKSESGKEIGFGGKKMEAGVEPEEKKAEAETDVRKSKISEDTEETEISGARSLDSADGDGVRTRKGESAAERRREEIGRCPRSTEEKLDSLVTEGSVKKEGKSPVEDEVPEKIKVARGTDLGKRWSAEDDGKRRIREGGQEEFSTAVRSRRAVADKGKDSEGLAGSKSQQLDAVLEVGKESWKEAKSSLSEAETKQISIKSGGRERGRERFHSYDTDVGKDEAPPGRERSRLETGSTRGRIHPYSGSDSLPAVFGTDFERTYKLEAVRIPVAGLRQRARPNPYGAKVDWHPLSRPDYGRSLVDIRSYEEHRKLHEMARRDLRRLTEKDYSASLEDLNVRLSAPELSTREVPREKKGRPVVCSRLVDCTAPRGSNVKLTCTILGNPEPSVKWLRHGLPLSIAPGDRYRAKIQDGIASLEIGNASELDNGEYTCLAENVHGEVTTSCKLKIFDGYDPAPFPPSFTSSLKESYRFAEDQLILECRVKCHPPPRVQWLRNGVPIRPSSRFQQTESSDGTCKLTIFGPEAEDSGDYTCRAENQVAEDSVSLRLKFPGRQHYAEERKSWTRCPKDFRKPHFRSELTDHLVPAGGTIALQVEVRGMPIPEVKWLHGNEELPRTSSKVRAFEDAGVYTLLVPNATEKEAGIYSCHAYNAFGHIRTTAAVEVLPVATVRGGKPPKIVNRPKDLMTANVEDDVIITCRVTGDPKPRVSWMKGTKDITITQRTMVDHTDDYFRFTLKKVVPADAGTYWIIAKNIHGHDRAFVTLQVKQRARSLTPGGFASARWEWEAPPNDSSEILSEIHDREKYNRRETPGPISSEPHVADSGRNWLTLSWKKPSNRGGAAPVIAYRVDAWEIGQDGGARWTELGITPVNTFDAFNLKNGKEYKFRVTPRNRYGWGEPLVTSRPIAVGYRATNMPEFTKILPGQLKSLLGSSIRFECHVKSDVRPQITWYKDGVPVDPDSPRITSDFDGTVCRLVISELVEEDSGRYMCEAINKIGRASTFARLMIVEDPRVWAADISLRRSVSDEEGIPPESPPQYTMRLRDRRVQMTYPVRLTCQVVGSPAPTVRWYHEGKQLTQDDRHTFFTEDHFHTLEMSKTFLEDAGCYTATAVNDYGSVSCRCNLVVDKGIRAYVAPEFVHELEVTRTVRFGDELRLKAQVEAYPSVGVVWYRNGVRLRPSRRIIMTLNHDGIVELTVANVTERDSGVYTCTATNEVGRSETVCRVTVCTDALQVAPVATIRDPNLPHSKAPVFIRKPRSSEAIEGDAVVIECQVIGDPKPEVFWLRDFLKPEYYRDAPHFVGVGEGPDYRLEIPHAKLDFTGTYSVVARNVHGEVKAVTSLQIFAKGQGKEDKMDRVPVTHGNVETLPIFKRDLRDIRCCDGDSVTFECCVEASSTPDIKWRKGGKLLPLGGDFVADFDGSVAKLTINQVYPEDEGEYSCEACNDLGKTNTSACLVVDVPEEKENLLSRQLNRPPGLMSGCSTPRSTPRTTPSRSVSPYPSGCRYRSASPSFSRPRRLKVTPPKFYAVPHNRIAQEGETVRFQCAVAGHPVPWVTWDKDGIVVTPTSRITLTEKEDLKILEISEVTVEDAGLYRIAVENDVGRIEATARLDVIGPNSYKKKATNVRAWSASPTFRRRLAGSIGRIGGNITLACDITSSPNPVTSWYRDGELVVRTMRVNPTWNGETAMLEIENLEKEDAGVYTCVAENEFGRCQCSAEVVVKDNEKGLEPGFVEALADAVAEEGDPVELKVRVKGDGPLDVVWAKDGKEIPDCEDFRYVDYGDGRFGLRIADAFTEDSGQYFCNVFNKYGDAVSSARLRVKENAANAAAPAIVFSKKPTSAVVACGKNAAFCSRIRQTESERVLISWSLNGREIPRNSSGKYTIEEDGDVSILHISCAELSDAGRVICTARYECRVCDGEKCTCKSPSASCSAELTVLSDNWASDSECDTIKCRETRLRSLSTGEIEADLLRMSKDSTGYSVAKEGASQALILRGPADKNVFRGGRVVLSATYCGQPEPQVRWMKGGHELENNDRIRIAAGDGKTSLTIDSISSDDSGKYVVHVENSHGSDRHFASLAVEGPPEPPSANPTVNALTRESVKVEWSSPAFDGGCKIIGYVIEMKAESQPDWKVASVVSDSFSHVVKDLRPEEKYKFRVRAENVHGRSEPGAESVQISLRDAGDEFSARFEPRNVALEEGDLFRARYEVLEELGKGRFGVVHKVADVETGLKLAAKFIRCITVKDREKVKEEIDIMNCLRHPKLLQLAAAFESPREMVMVMEYISGGELFERVVADDFQLTERDCILFMRQICEGVRYMHENSVVHLDLKPENIMCQTRTSHEIKLIDFGLAQRIDPEHPVRVLFGTPEFVPPEVINYEPIGFESDMWSVGVICYVLLSGLSPFMGENDAETFANITRASYDFDEEAFSAISQDAKDFISSLLVKRKEKRLTASDCLQNKWMLSEHDQTMGVILSTDKLKKFIIRRKWQKTGNAIRALGRLATLSAASRKNSGSNSIQSVSKAVEAGHVQEESNNFVDACGNTSSPLTKAPVSRCGPLCPKTQVKTVSRADDKSEIRSRLFSERSDSGISDCSSSSGGHSRSCHIPTSLTPLFGKKYSISENSAPVETVRQEAKHSPKEDATSPEIVNESSGETIGSKVDVIRRKFANLSKNIDEMDKKLETVGRKLVDIGPGKLTQSNKPEIKRVPSLKDSKPSNVRRLMQPTASSRAKAWSPKSPVLDRPLKENSPGLSVPVSPDLRTAKLSRVRQAIGEFDKINANSCVSQTVRRKKPDGMKSEAKPETIVTTPTPGRRFDGSRPQPLHSCSNVKKVETVSKNLESPAEENTDIPSGSLKFQKAVAFWKR